MCGEPAPGSATLTHIRSALSPITELVQLYDETTDAQLKEGLMSVFVESGEKAATDKLMQIARQDASTQLRRRALSHLSRSNDARVKEFLAGMVER